MLHRDSPILVPSPLRQIVILSTTDILLHGFTVVSLLIYVEGDLLVCFPSFCLFSSCGSPHSVKQRVFDRANPASCVRSFRERPVQRGRGGWGLGWGWGCYTQQQLPYVQLPLTVYIQHKLHHTQSIHPLTHCRFHPSASPRKHQ